MGTIDACHRLATEVTDQQHRRLSVLASVTPAGRIDAVTTIVWTDHQADL